MVHTGPVLLGAYTAAELTAVDAIVDFLETRPSADVLAEAVRSLAARQLLTAGSSGQQVQVQGDLGIAVAFQQRARMVFDGRSTGTVPGEPWRILLLPQPERICLMVRIDALGVHELGLYTLDDAIHFVADWLPRGEKADHNTSVDPHALIASSERSALITVTHYTTQGSAEIAGISTDLILARHKGRLHVFSREPADRATLVPRPLDGKDVRETLTLMLGRFPGEPQLPRQAMPGSSLNLGQPLSMAACSLGSLGRLGAKSLAGDMLSADRVGVEHGLDGRSRWSASQPPPPGAGKPASLRCCILRVRPVSTPGKARAA
jgi:hypothetical protein